MAQRGTPLTPLRLSADLLARIRAAIDSNNERRADKPYNLTSWIRQAITERLDKLERARQSNRKGKRAVAGELAELPAATDQGEGKRAVAGELAELPAATDQGEKKRAVAGELAELPAATDQGGGVAGAS